MDFDDLFYKLNYGKINKNEFSKKLFEYYKDRELTFYDLRDDLINYASEDLDGALSEYEDVLFNDNDWSICFQVGNEDDGYDDCYLYIYYTVNGDTITVTNIELD